MVDNRQLQADNGTFFGFLPPAVAGVARGITLAAVTAVVGYLITYFSTLTTGDLAPWAPVAVLVLRTVEGFIDKAATGE